MTDVVVHLGIQGDRMTGQEQRTGPDAYDRMARTAVGQSQLEGEPAWLTAFRQMAAEAVERRHGDLRRAAAMRARAARMRAAGMSSS